MYKLKVGDDGYAPTHMRVHTPNIIDPRCNFGNSRWIRHCYQYDIGRYISHNFWSTCGEIYIGFGTILDRHTFMPYILEVSNGEDSYYVIDKALYRNKNFSKAVKIAESAIKQSNNYRYGDISEYIAKPEKKTFKSPRAKRQKEAEILKRFQETKEFEKGFMNAVSRVGWDRRESFLTIPYQLFNF